MKKVSRQALQAFKKWGKKGGRTRARNLSLAKRRAISRHAAQMRWGRQAEETAMPSVRLEGAIWDNPVYLEEILSYGSLRDWRELRERIADRPFGSEAAALEKVLGAADIYGAVALWKRVLGHLRGDFS